MENWIKGAITGAALYILINLAFLLSGNSQYQQLVQRDIIKNVIPFLLWILVFSLAGLVIGWVINKIKSRNSN